jgi:hypothetical protein
MALIYVLIVLFAILILYQAFLPFFVSNSLVEGLENNESTSTTEYQAYNVNDPNNALILSQQNAGNIEVLKGRIDGLDGVKEKVDNIQQSIDSMQVQIDGLVQQQADYAQELAGSEPVEITGTEEETTEDVEDEIENS